MEKSTPVRKSHTSTADLLVWPENTQTPEEVPKAVWTRQQQQRPGGGISAVLFGGQMTEEEAAAETISKRKPCSEYKRREITGSGIFAAASEDGASESGGGFSTSSSKTGLRLYQQAATAISQISFGAEESISPRKPTSLAEVAKQRELSGSLESEPETKLKKQISDAKCKELSGHDIFGPPENPPRPLAARNLQLKDKDMGEPLPPRNKHTSVKVSNPAGGPSSIVFSEDNGVKKPTKKIHNQKLAELSGNDIFKGDAPSSSAEKALSVAKLKEMSGNDIFADGKSAARDYFGGVRKPPGGESSIALL